MRSQPRSGKRRHVLRWVAVAAVVVVAAGTLGAYLKYRAVYDSITRVTVPSTALGHRPPVYSANSENILVYGDDTRAGLTPHQQFVLHAGHDQTNNTDTIMLVHISPGHHGVTAVSIPRDTMVPEYECDSGPGYTGQQANPAGTSSRASSTSPVSRRWPSGGPARTSATAPTCSESSGTSSCPPRSSRACCTAGCCPTRSGC